jgi:replicative DNA helicase
MNDLQWKAWRDDVKRRIDIRQLIGQVVELRGQNPATGCCPFHQERSPSFKVWADHYHCYGCDAHGDVFSWLEHQGFDGLTEAARLAGVALPHQTSPKTSSPPLPEARENPAVPEMRQPPIWIPDLVKQAQKALLKAESGLAKQAWAYLEQRGLAGMAELLQFGVVDASIKLPQAGSKLESLRGRLLIPTIAAGQAVFFKARYLGADANLKAQGIMKYDGPPGQMPCPFNPDALLKAATFGYLLLTEGELDAASVLTACGLDHPVLGLPGGRIPKGWEEKIAQSGAKVYVLMDNDEAGARHAVAIKTSLEALGVRVRVLELPDHNDLNQALTERGAEGLNLLLEQLRLIADASAISDYGYIHSQFFDEMDARFQRPHRSYNTGLPELDKALEGGFAEGLHILGGITGGGKTSFALNVAIHNALAGRSVLYASFEQSRYELWARIVARVTHVSQGAIKRGAFVHDDGSAEPVSALIDQTGRWGEVLAIAKHLRIVEGGDALSRNSGAWSIETIRQTAALMAEANGSPPLVIVDYLQRVPSPPSERISDPRERISYVAGALQVRLARELGCPVLALSSVSRASYRLAETDLEGRLAAFKEAGELEYTAYTAMLLYALPNNVQDELGFGKKRFAGAALEHPIAIDLVKNREGQRGRLVGAWSPRGDKWREIGVWNEGESPRVLATR